jgi:hypothetical protein
VRTTTSTTAAAAAADTSRKQCYSMKKHLADLVVILHLADATIHISEARASPHRITL